MATAFETFVNDELPNRVAFSGTVTAGEKGVFVSTGTAKLTSWSKYNLAASTNPGITNDVNSGYGPGSLWYNTVGVQLWLCVDGTAGAAVWVEINSVGLTSAQTAAAVWGAAKASYNDAGTFGEEVQLHSLSTEISALNNLSSAQVTTACTSSLNTYDPPTKAELDTAVTTIRGADSDTLKTLSDQIDAIDATGIQAACNAALVAIGLDHLVGASVDGADIANNSIVARMASKSTPADWDSFVNTTDSLEGLRDFFVSSGVSPVASTYDTNFFIGRVLKTIRQLADIPSTRAKYTDDDLLRYVKNAWSFVLQDVNNVSTNPIVVRHDIAISSANQDYILPPTVGEILRLAKINSTTDAVEWEMVPRGRLSIAGPGFTLEGNIIRVSPKWTESHTLRLEYIPTGFITLTASDTCAAVDSTNGLTLDLDTTPAIATMIGPTLTLDRRPNAYVGSILRIVNHASWTGGANTQTITQERIITGQTIGASEIRLTVSPAFSPLPTAATTPAYEVVPIMYEEFEMPVALHVTQMILEIEGEADRARTMKLQYLEKIRMMKIAAKSRENRVGGKFDADTPENSRRWGEGYWGG